MVDALSPRDAIMTLLCKRGTGKSICPSEAARLLAPEEWGAQMDTIRTAAAGLVAEGRVRVTQKGRVVDLRTAHGPIRLALTEAADG